MMEEWGTDSSVTVLRKCRIADVAKLAGVGTATVDRVLNNRGRVRDSTRQRVMQAKAAIEMGMRLAGGSRPWRLKVFLPDTAGPSTEYLGQCFQDFGMQGNATIECTFTAKMKPDALARKLRACERQGIDAVAFQALEDRRVREAVEHLRVRRIPSLALLSPLDGAPLIGFIGSDSHAGGRTAGLLAGLSCPQGGKFAILSGGPLYRLHENREAGFRAHLSAECPHLEVLGTVNGQDDIRRNHQRILQVLDAEPGLAGIYSVGGGNEGVVRALKERGLAGEVKFIGHNLTPKTRGYLLDGSMQFVVHQDMRLVARFAVDAMTACLERRPTHLPTVPVEIITRENIYDLSYGRPQPEGPGAR